MDQREIDELRALCDSHAEQDEYGVDLTLIDEMLALTPTERLEALEQAMEADDALGEAGRKFYGFDPRDVVEAEFGRR
jgi:hypothetical protein